MAIRIFVKCKKHQSHNCRLDCRHFLKQLATLLFSSSTCPCPSQSPEAHIYQLTVNRTHCCSFSKVIDFHIAVSAHCCVCSLVSALGSGPAAGPATRRQAGGGHMLLPSERSGNKCATNGGPSTPPSSSFS